MSIWELTKCQTAQEENQNCSVCAVSLKEEHVEETGCGGWKESEYNDQTCPQEPVLSPHSSSLPMGFSVACCCSLLSPQSSASLSLPKGALKS